MTTTNRMVCIILTLLLLATLPALSWAQDELSKPLAKSVFHLPGELTSKPIKLNHYLVLDPLLSNLGEVKRLASAFELSAEVETRERQYLVKDEGRTLEVFRQAGTGYIRFSDDVELGAEKAALQLPSPEKAAEMATDFLSKQGLLPKSARLLGRRYSEFMELDEKGQAIRSGNSSIAVIYGFEVDGKRVRGPGAKAGVVFGDGGKVIGASLIWRRIKKDGDMQLISLKEAFERFKRIWPPDDNEAADIQTDIHIEGIEVTYYAKPGMYPQKYLEPVYAFGGFYEVSGKIKDKELYEKEYFEVLVPATIDSDAPPISTWGPQRALK